VQYLAQTTPVVPVPRNGSQTFKSLFPNPVPFKKLDKIPAFSKIIDHIKHNLKQIDEYIMQTVDIFEGFLLRRPKIL